MAIKNTESRIIPADFEDICAVLRDPDFSKAMQVEYVEEAILPDGVEFRYRRMSTAMKYGRNYFVKLKKAENATEAAVTTQSRKVTVLIDPLWKTETGRVYDFLEMLLRRKEG